MIFQLIAWLLSGLSLARTCYAAQRGGSRKTFCRDGRSSAEHYSTLDFDLNLSHFIPFSNTTAHRRITSLHSTARTVELFLLPKAHLLFPCTHSHHVWNRYASTTEHWHRQARCRQGDSCCEDAREAQRCRPLLPIRLCWCRVLFYNSRWSHTCRCVSWRQETERFGFARARTRERGELTRRLTQRQDPYPARPSHLQPRTDRWFPSSHRQRGSWCSPYRCRPNLCWLLPPGRIQIRRI